MHKSFGADAVRNEVILIARLLLMALFLLAGWNKLIDMSATAGYFAGIGVPMPTVAAVAAIAIELGAGVAIILGIFTQIIAPLLAVYTIATALIGHHYWTMTGPAGMNNMIHFYKNLGIAGGFLLLYVTGAGRFSIDNNLSKRNLP
jgi:putative oxidoreductase